jgi:hypothetical protein
LSVRKPKIIAPTRWMLLALGQHSLLSSAGHLPCPVIVPSSQRIRVVSSSGVLQEQVVLGMALNSITALGSFLLNDKITQYTAPLDRSWIAYLFGASSDDSFSRTSPPGLSTSESITPCGWQLVSQVAICTAELPSFRIERVNT